MLNPDLLKDKKGGRAFAGGRQKDRIDTIIAHEWAEHGTLDQAAALKAAAGAELAVSDGERRVLRAMGR